MARFVQFLEANVTHNDWRVGKSVHFFSFSEGKTLQKKISQIHLSIKISLLISAQNQLNVVIQLFWHFDCKYLAVNNSIIFLDVKEVMRGIKNHFGI